MTTVSELIKALQAIEDQNLEVELSISVYDKVYPCYASINKTAWGNIVTYSPHGKSVRLNCSLNDPVGSEGKYYTVREMKKR